MVLALAAAVLAVAGYVWWSSGPTPEKPSPHGEATLAKEVLSKAKSAIAAGDPTAAINLMQTYIRTHPSDVEVRPFLARTYWTAGQTPLAEEVLTGLQRLAPNLASALWLRGEMAKARGDRDYLKYFAQAMSSPTVEPAMVSLYATELLAHEKDAEAEKFLNRATAAGLKDVPTLHGLGLLALKRKEYAKAEDQFREALKIERTNAPSWRMLATAQREDGHPEKALATIQEALKATRDRAALNLELGRTLVILHRPAEATDAFAAAADLSALPAPERVEAALEAAIGHYNAARFAQAMKYIDLALSLDPANERARQWVTKIEDARFSPATMPASRP